MIRRTFDAARVNELVNHPTIRPHVGGEGELDLSALLADRRNVCLIADGGGAIFAWRGPGVFEGHSFFLARGREAIRLGRTMLDWMQDAMGAQMIWGLTPEANRAARMFSRLIGMKSLGMQDTPEGRCELFVTGALCQ